MGDAKPPPEEIQEESKGAGQETAALAQTDYQLYEALNLLKGLALLQPQTS
jgi:hypothetical protein